jgi:serine/threonine-protein kinase RsbW
MRDALSGYLAAHGVACRTAREVVLAAEEALTNAIVHAGDAQGRIVVEAVVADDEATVEVRDSGCGFDVHAVDVTRAPDNSRPRGRGLFLIRRMMDRVDIISGDGGTAVHMVRRLA